MITGVLVFVNPEKKATTALKAIGSYKILKYSKIVSYPIFNTTFILDQLKVRRFFLYWSTSSARVPRALGMDVFNCMDGEQGNVYNCMDGVQEIVYNCIDELQENVYNCTDRQPENVHKFKGEPPEHVNNCKDGPKVPVYSSTPELQGSGGANPKPGTPIGTLVKI